MSKIKISLFFVLIVLFSFSSLIIAQDLPEITMWAKSGPEGTALEKAAAVYEENTGNSVKVEIMGRSGYRSKYRTVLMSGSSEVDGILDVAYTVPTLAAGGFLANMDEYVKNNEDYNYTQGLPEAVQEEMKFDGSWYMLPTDLSAESMVYRTDLFPHAPETWSELVEFAKEYTQKYNEDSPTKYGYAFCGAPNVIHGTWRSMRYAFGGRIINDEGEVMVDDPKTIESFEFLVDLKRKHEVTPPDVTSWDYPEVLTALQEGVVASASFFTAGMPILTDPDESPKVYDKIKFVAQPSGPAGAFTRINPLGVMVNASSERKEATWEFLKWLTGPEGGELYTEFGGTNPRESIIMNEKWHESRPWYPDLYEAVQSGGVGSLNHAKSSQITDTFNKWAGRVLNGNMTTEEAFNECAEELRDLLDQ